VTDRADPLPMTDVLLADAVVVAEAARVWFGEEAGVRHPAEAGAEAQLACESLRVTSRLLHVVAWALTRRALAAGELSAAEALAPERRLSPVPGPDPAALDLMTDGARAVAEESVALHRRAALLDAALDEPAALSPALLLQQRIAVSLGA
jgi:regulator of CtrA degradation